LIARWIRGEVAPPPKQVRQQQLVPHREAIASALELASKGTRSERSAVKRARLACGEKQAAEGAICLYPLTDAPFVVSPVTR
ncbi:MAG: hypothetical protein ACPG4T_17180, partial [Nannocystaceae bacterium]